MRPLGDGEWTVWKNIPQGLKPRSLWSLYGTTKVVP
jgi:hypothetical protein